MAMHNRYFMSCHFEKYSHNINPNAYIKPRGAWNHIVTFNVLGTTRRPMQVYAQGMQVNTPCGQKLQEEILFYDV